MASAAAGASVVSARRKETFPPPTVRSLTNPKETMSREKPGYLTCRRASRTVCSFSVVVDTLASLSKREDLTSGPLGRESASGAKREDFAPDPFHQLATRVHGQARCRDRMPGAHANGAAPHGHPLRSEDGPGSGDAHGHDRHAGLQRRQETGLLERAEAAVAGPRTLGEDEDGRALREAFVELREDVLRLVDPPPVHGHEAREPHRPAHERNPEKRPLREEAHVLPDREEKQKDVDAGLVVRHVDHLWERRRVARDLSRRGDLAEKQDRQIGREH